MAPTKLITVFSISIIGFFLLVDSMPFEDFGEKGGYGDADSFYSKLCSGVFDNESAEERVVDRTFECQSLYLPDTMRRCVLEEYNISNYPWNVSLAKSIVCVEPNGCDMFNRSTICVQNEAEQLDEDIRNNFTSLFTNCLREGLDTNGTKNFTDQITLYRLLDNNENIKF